MNPTRFKGQILSTMKMPYSGERSFLEVHRLALQGLIDDLIETTTLFACLYWTPYGGHFCSVYAETDQEIAPIPSSSSDLLIYEYFGNFHPLISPGGTQSYIFS